MIFQDEEGVQDYKEAVKWYRLAAEQGDSFGQSCLGMMYEYGDGVPENSVQAWAWYNLAAAGGDKDAKKYRRRLKLTPEQLIEAQALSTEIQKRIEANKKD